MIPSSKTIQLITHRNKQTEVDTSEKPLQLAADADPTQVQETRDLLAPYDAQLQATLNKHLAVLDPVVLQVDSDKLKVRRSQVPALLVSELRREEAKSQIKRVSNWASPNPYKGRKRARPSWQRNWTAPENFVSVTGS